MQHLPSSADGPKLHPLVQTLAASIRVVRDTMPGIVPLVIDPNLMDISGALDNQTLSIRNELHRCRGMRKLHLETARLGAGLEILHCVFFPDPCFDLPVFGTDVVIGPSGISAAIVDLSPVASTLPAAMEHQLESRTPPPFRQVRKLPAWGSIFSPHVCFIRPADSQEESWFVEEALDYLRILVTAAETARPEEPSAGSTIGRYYGQVGYCRQQKRNDKTRRVLARAFNSDWADHYIEKILFDDPLPP